MSHPSGNIKTALNRFQADRMRYLESPNHCRCCERPILPKDGEPLNDVKIRKFCNRSCAGTYQSRNFPGPIMLRAQGGITCRVCGVKFTPPKVAGEKRSLKLRRCPACRDTGILNPANSILTKTKGEMFARRCNWQSARSTIQRHARQVYVASGGRLQCCICDYDRHVHIAHRRAVSEFPDEAPVVVINDLSNLAPLCPNHHWEFDHGILSLI